MSRLFAAVDVETDGLDPRVNQIIEVGIVREVEDGGLEEYEFSLPFMPGEHSSEAALEINGWGRREVPQAVRPIQGAQIIMNALAGRHIVGKNPQFDAAFLNVLVSGYGQEPSWHHRLVDVGMLAWGWHNGKQEMAAECGRLDALGNARLQPPNMESTMELLGLEIDPDKAHSALYDARMAYDAFRVVVPR